MPGRKGYAGADSRMRVCGTPAKAGEFAGVDQTLECSAVALLSAAMHGTLARSRLREELLQRYDVTDVASLVFRDRFGGWGFLDLWKMAGSRPFSAGDIGFLRALVPPSNGEAPVPASADNIAAQLLAVEAGVDEGAPSARVHLAEGRWLVQDHLKAMFAKSSTRNRSTMLTHALGR